MNSCIQCGGIPKYKCPTCLQPYCSVLCCKEHKERPCSAPSKPEVNALKETSINYEFPTEDTVPPEKLELLKSTELKKCLENPHVRTILELLDKSPHPDELIQKYMQEPIFTEFVDACLNVVEPEETVDKL
ncbi:zinc finger HIT domain-containing protein 3 isoform X2 [Achroia grisella]|uniref:zinc finger HIT domain-containing protein 3 isoform X2 n=1 Tax=Achroia grisella TaxID=688607 RepID=UPI0027D21637|nr:zinc finger HIT domain-containing protein 3 isoform X2 [Achroia grisella]